MDDKESLLRFERQIRFIVEMDRLKLVLRRTLLTDESRLENTAEHSWHVTLMAVLLREHADAGVDVDRVVRMLLVHDLVEIDAGDTFAYDLAANIDKAEREARAADRVFGLLPDDQAAELRALWEEFESGATIDARYAVALDRLQPLLQNVHARGGAWRTHGVTQTQVLERMRPVAAATPGLWSFVEHTIETVWATGFIRKIDP